MAEKNRYATLNNGLKMPLMGYGTFLSTDESVLKECLKYAILECGYRHIDTAALYENEQVIGDVLKECFESGIKREDLFIVTKLWRDRMNNVEEALRESLTKLQLDYVDLYLIHWTVTDVDWDTFEVKGPPMYEVWKNMENMQDLGLTKSIGISNCNAMLFVDMYAGAKYKPVTNQIECNPVVSQSKLVGFTGKFGCTTTAYAPIGAAAFTGSSSLLENEAIKKIAEKHSATVAQVCLAWNMARGVIVIPKSLTKERIKENFDALDVTLDEEDVQTLNELEDNSKRAFNPESWNAPQYGWKYTPIFY